MKTTEDEILCTPHDGMIISYYYYYYYYYYKCHGLECCQSHSYGGILQKSRFKTVAQLNADVC